MKKDIEWLVKMINEELDMLQQKLVSGKGTPNQNTFDEGRGWALSHVLRMMYYPDKLEELSKELPVIPKYVAGEFDYDKNPYWEVDEAKDVSHILKCAFGNEAKPSEFLEWVRENPEDYVMAVRNGFEVEKEQKYYVDLDTAAYVAKWNGNDHVDIYTHDISGSDELEFHLTEQEIKDYDERFWPFAVKVGEEDK